MDAKYSTKEILAKAGMNTLLGMGTVFVVLIFISFLIARFKIIPTLFGPKKKEEPVSAPAVSAPVSVPEAAPETDDTELIAVIAAAIAAAREADGMDEASAGGFFVRSIRRRPANKWKA